METPQTDLPQIGLIGRMLRVFHAPGEAFEALSCGHSKMDWLVPTILVAVVGFPVQALPTVATTQIGREVVDLDTLETVVRVLKLRR